MSEGTPETPPAEGEGTQSAPAPAEGAGPDEGGSAPATPDEGAGEGPDYAGSQGDIDAAKQAAHEADRQRLAEEHGQ